MRRIALVCDMLKHCYACRDRIGKSDAPVTGVTLTRECATVLRDTGGLTGGGSAASA